MCYTFSVDAYQKLEACVVMRFHLSHKAQLNPPSTISCNIYNTVVVKKKIIINKLKNAIKQLNTLSSVTLLYALSQVITWYS